MTCVLLRPQNEPRVIHNLDKIENLIKISENKYMFCSAEDIIYLNDVPGNRHIYRI